MIVWYGRRPGSTRPPTEKHAPRFCRTTPVPGAAKHSQGGAGFSRAATVGQGVWSADITPSDNPYEAGLGFCVRLGKGDFIGREALVRAKAEGVTRRLATVTIDPAATIYGGEAVWRDGRLLGRLRSGGYGYTVGRNIGFVYLPVDLAQAENALMARQQEGDELIVKLRGQVYRID